MVGILRKQFLLGVTPTWAIWFNGNIPRIRMEEAWGHEHKKPALSLKRL